MQIDTSLPKRLYRTDRLISEWSVLLKAALTQVKIAFAMPTRLQVSSQANIALKVFIIKLSHKLQSMREGADGFLKSSTFSTLRYKNTRIDRNHTCHNAKKLSITCQHIRHIYRKVTNEKIRLFYFI